MIYLLVLSIFFTLIYVYDVKGYKKSKKAWFCIECIILILLFGLRYRLGGDSLSYEDNWSYMPSLSEYKEFLNLNFGGYQPLYYLFVAFVKKISDSFVTFQIFHAIVVNIVVFRTIRKYCKHIFTATTFYFIFYSFNYNTEILRESLSISVFLLSLDFLLSKKYIKYYLCCFVALGFHISSLFLFILPFVFKYLSKSWSISRVALAIALAMIAGSYVIRNLEFFSTLQILGSYNQGSLEYYSFENDESRTLKGYIFMMIDFVVYLMLLRLTKQCAVNNTWNNFAVNLKLVLSMFTPLFPVISWRFSGYIGVLFYITIADMIYSIPSAKIKRSFLIVFVYLCLSFIYGQVVTDSDNSRNARTFVRYVPYTSILTKEKVLLREGILEN